LKKYPQNPRIARVIITLKCLCSCHYCCNKYETIMSNAVEISNIAKMDMCDILCITGGEPMLDPDKTLKIIALAKRINPSLIIYLYTAWFSEQLPEIIDAVDGIHFTLHSNANNKDIDNFQRFQEMLREYADKSFRLYINSNIKRPITIYPYLWKRVETKPWLSEETLLAVQPNGLPKNEALYIKIKYLFTN